MKKWLLIFGMMIACVCHGATKVYDFNSLCQQAYKEITQLKINNGLALIEKAKHQNPNNLIPYVLENYADFFVLFFNEDPAEYKRRRSKMEERIELLKQGPQSSPLYNFCLSVVYLHKSAIEIKSGEWWAAGWDGKKAYQYIKENQKEFPLFIPNYLLYGTFQTIIGTIPKEYKWVASLFGIRGSISDGMKNVRYFLNSSDSWSKMMSNEGSFLYCYLMFYFENKKDETLQYIQTQKLDVINNHLLAYMAANLAINNKQTEYAKSVILNRNKSPEYLSTGVWNYELGLTKLNHLETNEAIACFERYLSGFKGRFYVKDTYQRISWAYYLQGNMVAAQNARNNVLKKGGTDSDADKQALKEAKTGKWPNQLLLKARLLSDGGYNKEALQLLAGKSKKDFNKEEDQLEFVYRVARIYDDIGHDDEAIKFYLLAIQIGENRTEYYAARAAIQIGMIYEKRNDKKNAIAYYQKSLDMDDHDYKNSLDQRAKSGIARCKGE